MAISSGSTEDESNVVTTVMDAAAATIVTDNAGTTTNAEDQRAVAELKERIAQSNKLLESTSSSTNRSAAERVPFVSIDEGQWKYVLISAEEPVPSSSSFSFNSSCCDDECPTVFFVTSKRGAAYHRNVAEPYVEKLQSSGYRNIHVAGGGRLYFNPQDKKIRIFGFSYGFGLADHATSKQVIEQDDRFKDYDITWSNEGY